MKKLIIAVLIAACFTSCKKDKVADKPKVDPCGTIIYSNGEGCGCSGAQYTIFNFIVKYSDNSEKHFYNIIGISGYAVGSKYCK